MLVAALVGLTLPAAAVVIYASLRPLWVGADLAADGALERTYRAIAIRVVIFVLALQALIMLSVVGATWLRPIAPRAVVVLFGLFLVAIGDALPRTRPNPLFGLRTARTLQDRQLWIRLHRMTGYLAVASGLAISLAGTFLSKDGMAWVIGTSALCGGVTLATVYTVHVRRTRTLSVAHSESWQKTALWTLRVLLAIAFFYFGITKFPGHGMWVRLFDRIGFGQWFRILTGFMEAGGAVLLLTPRGLVPAVVVLSVTMVGALLVHVFIVGVGLPTFVVVALLALLIGVAVAFRMS